MKQAIAYLRKSTDMQETSFEQQKKDVLVFANVNEIEVVRFFEEEACGEHVEGRPQFRTMIEFCKVSREPFQSAGPFLGRRYGPDAGHAAHGKRTGSGGSRRSSRFG